MITICVLAIYGNTFILPSFAPPKKEYYLTRSEAACERLKTQRGASWTNPMTTEIGSPTYKRRCGDKGQDCIPID